MQATEALGETGLGGGSDFSPDRWGLDVFDDQVSFRCASESHVQKVAPDPSVAIRLHGDVLRSSKPVDLRLFKQP